MPAAITTTTAKEVRETRLHFLGTKVFTIATTVASDVIQQIGHDNTDMSRASAWNTTSEKVVTGVTTASSTRAEETLGVDPWYCRKDDLVGIMLQDFDQNELELDNIKHWYYEAKVDSDGNTIYAFKKLADVKPTSFGGAADNADSIPFELSLSGKKIELDFDFATMTFTEVAVTP